MQSKCCRYKNQPEPRFGMINPNPSTGGLAGKTSPK
jgi:hypothetical protein